MTMFISQFDAEQHCRAFCRPVRTGFGEVAVRPINAADAGLSGASRYFRFFQPLKSLSPAMLERFVGTDCITHMALAGVVDIDGAPRMIAEARFAVNADGASADIALAVADQWQRRGVATGLMATLERIAESAGIARLTGECLAINQAFAGLARSLDFDVRSDASDCSLLTVEKRIGEPGGSSGAARRSMCRSGTDAICAIGLARGW